MNSLEIKSQEIADKLNHSDVDFEYSRDKGDAEAALEIINNHTFTAKEIEDTVSWVNREFEGDERVIVDTVCAELIDDSWNLETVMFFIH